MKKVLIIIFSCFLHINIFAQKADDILGKWINEDNDRTIEIYKNNDLYYGKVVWLKNSEKGVGIDRLDLKNHNTLLENRKIIGIDYLLGFSYFTDRKAWKEGQIYNYETGNTYHGKIKINDKGGLDLKGYYGILWFLGRTQTLNRVK